jgi:hypothetical protein
MYCHRIIVSEEHPNSGVDLSLRSFNLSDFDLSHGADLSRFPWK